MEFLNQQTISFPTQFHHGSESIISVIKYKGHDTTVHKMERCDLYSSQFTVWLSMHLQNSFMYPATVVMYLKIQPFFTNLTYENHVFQIMYHVLK